MLLVEDEDFTRATLAAALERHGVEVVATARDARTAMEVIGGSDFDVAVLDLDLGPGPTGVDIAQALRHKQPEVGILILTSFADPRLLSSSLRELPPGANYVVKQSLASLDLLLAAIEGSLALDGGLTLDATVTGLTDAQIDTLRLLAAGLSNAEIARIRVVTEKTVEQSIARAARRLGVTSTSDVNQRVALAREYFRLTGSFRHARTQG